MNHTGLTFSKLICFGSKMPDRHVDPDQPDIKVRRLECVGLYLHTHLEPNL